MKDKIVTIALSIILFLVPAVILPSTWAPYNFAKIIILLICGLALLITTLLRIDELKFDKIDIPILIFGLLAILSTIFSKDPYMSLFGTDNRFEGMLTIIIYILIYYNSKYYFKNYKYFKTILSVIYILICTLGILQFYLRGLIKIPTIFSGVASATFGNTNFMGSFVSLVVPAFILGSILKNRKIYYIGSMISFSSMLLCLARSSWVAFFVSTIAIIIYLIIKKDKKYWKRFAILTILLVLCFTTIKLTDKTNIVLGKMNIEKTEIGSIFKTGITNKMGSGRVSIWKLTLKLIGKVPVLGCGVDALEVGLEEKLPEENSDFIVKSGVYIDKAHNEYLQIAATMGIPALLAYLTFIGMLGINSIKQMLKKDEIAICGIVILSYLVQAFFNISTIGVAPIFWFVLGMQARNIKNLNIKSL